MPANTQYFRVEYGLDVNLDAVIGKELSVTNTASFGNNVTIQGDLVVNGQTTFNDSQLVELGTGQVVFVSGAQGAPSTDARLTVNRGASANVEIRWNETLDTWQFTNNGTNYYPLKSYSDLTYQFSTLNSTNVDPGSGLLRFNNGTPSLVTQISIDNTELGGTDVSAYIDSLDDSNNTVKGFLLFRSSVNQDRFIVYELNSITTQTGYRQFSVTHVSGSTLFTNDDVLFLSFLRSGDKGDKGEKGEKGQKGERVSSGNFDSGTNSLLFTNSDGSTFTVAGIKGDKGSSGEKGNKGDTGAQGIGGPGAQGDLGPGGPQGNKGDTGAKGEPGGPGGPGVAGPQGNLGAQGLKGDVGPQGSKGDKGDKGAQGGPGPAGPQGSGGDKGNNGAQGQPGPAGTVIDSSSDLNIRSLRVNTGAVSINAGEILAAGDITAFYSDLRLKKNIEEIKDATKKLLMLTGVYYSQNELAEKFGYNDYRRQLGLIAQEVQKICPEAVRLAPFDLDENGISKSGENYLTIKYERLIPLLIQSIKEIDKRVSDLENK